MEHINLGKDIAVESIGYNNPYSYRKLHRHEYYEILLFDSGNGGKQIIDFVEYEIAEMSLFLIMPGQVHLMNRMPNENGIAIQFNRSSMNQCLVPLKIDTVFKMLLNTEIKLSKDQYDDILPFFKKIKKVSERTGKLRYYKMIRLLGYILFDIFDIISEINESPSIDNIAYQFLKDVYENIRQIRSVQEYAELLNISTNTLVRVTQVHLGKSPLETIHEILLIEVKRLMFAEQLTHKEIAYELSFDSQSSYSRFVKKHAGLTPSLLKKQLGQIAQ